MPSPALQLAQIGNSHGVRLPKILRHKYGWTKEILVEERPEGLLLRRNKRGKLSWDDTFKAMAASGENWKEWDAVTADGLDK